MSLRRWESLIEAEFALALGAEMTHMVSGHVQPSLYLSFVYVDVREAREYTPSPPGMHPKCLSWFNKTLSKDSKAASKKMERRKKKLKITGHEQSLMGAKGALRLNKHWRTVPSSLAAVRLFLQVVLSLVALSRVSRRCYKIRQWQ